MILTARYIDSVGGDITDQPMKKIKQESAIKKE